MHTIRKWIRFLFGFSRRETNGFLILLPLMVAVIFSQPLYRTIVPPDPPDFSREAAILDSLQALQITHAPRTEEQEAVPRMFVFDPNKATAAEFESLGIPGNVAHTIVNYRAKGGRFRRKSDLLRIYGLDTATFERLHQYIDLPEMVAAPRRAGTEKPKRRDAVRKTSLTRFDLNEADTATLKAVRGIGPVLAERIVRYRASLGGFVSADQLFEVYRLDSAVARVVMQMAFIRGDFVPRKLPLNTSGEHTLASHPYVGKAMAKTIVAYRFQHGPFESIGDIRKIHQVNDSVFQRIHPYLSLD